MIKFTNEKRDREKGKERESDREKGKEKKRERETDREAPQPAQVKKPSIGLSLPYIKSCAVLQ